MSVRILVGDARTRLAELPDRSVHCCVTSPPYFGLRDYGTAVWDGGDPGCNHASIRRGHGSGEKQSRSAGSSRDRIRSEDCHQCGAQRIDAQISLEETPDEYVAALVEIFREVRRVLRDDGTLWLVLGDSYAGSWGAQGRRVIDSDDPTWHGSQIKNHPKRQANTGTIRQAGLKPKDLIGIPWRVAFALQADGWWLRSDIIWTKPNPKPESIRDRPTSAHEHIFLLAKSERYFFDQEAVREPYAPATLERPQQATFDQQAGGSKDPQTGNRSSRRALVNLKGQIPAPQIEDAPEQYNLAGRNIRNVWTIATEPSSIPHFAMFPTDLVERCIKAGCPSSGVVLDPFAGAGTTGLVADRLGRHAVLIELNEQYSQQARARIDSDAPLFSRTEIVPPSELPASPMPTELDLSKIDDPVLDAARPM